MARYRPGQPKTESIVRPQCPQCGARMMLARMVPKERGQEAHTFECPECDHSLVVSAKV